MFAKKTISIEIGTATTKVVIGKSRKNNINIEQVWKIPTPVDTFDDGEIVNLNVMIETLDKFLDENKIKLKEVVFTLQSTKAITREIIIPYVKKEEDLTQMVQLEIEQYLPIRLEDYIIEYRILEELITEESKNLVILIVALPKNIVEGYLNLTEVLKLKPISLDINATAVTKFSPEELVKNNENTDLDKTVALLDCGYEYLNLTIIENGIMRFTRLLNYGGKDIDMSLANVFNLSLQEAEERKLEYADLTDTVFVNDSQNMVNENIKTSIDTWIQEIQKVFRFYSSRKVGNKIDEIYLYGGSSNIPGMPEYLDKMMNIPTFKINKVHNVNLDNLPGEIVVGDYLNAIASLKGR
ncbi:type IV pilus assembly protein PilM [Desulfonispora thiosulfatigenes DSM 11270]|uniref:Chaperone protein DnaK n=1 Tax=Desulfonispora thiosulfatigenes DSM 11270 TaxID=656914 RepID=A0A1W1VNT9_DESTI|nr:type IV pilus assembly protein PilM [Desulfonispora thiosulfatigenes]SMB94998.1 type IV pilus assembly protein PilM [Desulfonispora thiosulfatigenes DSM 11270]